VNTGDRELSSLNELAALSVEDEDLETIAGAVVDLAISTIGCEYAGLTVFGRKEFRSLAPSDPLVEQADKLQHALHEGPCVDAADESDTYVANDLATDPRWPHWGPEAAALGFTSLLATRLAAGERTLGALNLYSASARDFDADDRDFAKMFATHAAVTLMTVQQRETLLGALDARTLIGQAQGILMERFDIDADRAFGVLRRYSQARNVKLRAVAEDLVSSRSLPAPPP
jgi:GAF domain-containing protein